MYSEIYRVLKPGCVFACYEWCLTDKYDASNDKHRLIKKQIEVTKGKKTDRQRTILLGYSHCLVLGASSVSLKL